MSSRASKILVILTAILLLSILSPRVSATNDSSPGNLTITTNSTSASTTTNDTLNTMGQLSQGVNDPQYNQLNNQLATQLRTGDNLGAQQTLKDLQSYAQTPQGSKLPASLRGLVASMTVGSDGLSVDPLLLQQFIGNLDSNGMPTGWAGMDPNRAARDLFALSNLMENIDPTASLNLLRDFNQLQNSISLGLFGGGLQPPKIPSIPKLPNVNFNLPGGLGSPSLPNVKASLPGVPPSLTNLNAPFLLIITVAIAAVAGLLILFRKRLLSIGRHVTPTTFKPKSKYIPELGLNLQNPRDLIIYYFRKVVGAMSKRGVPRLDPDTHREFSDKCSPRPEAPPVKNITVLFEKAVFSGREVSQPDADEAKQYAIEVENVFPAGGKKQRFGKSPSRAQPTPIS